MLSSISLFILSLFIVILINNFINLIIKKRNINIKKKNKVSLKKVKRELERYAKNLVPNYKEKTASDSLNKYFEIQNNEVYVFSDNLLLRENKPKSIFADFTHE